MVRGAYIIEESHLAKAAGYENPVCDGYEATTNNINRNFSEIVRNMTPGSEARNLFNNTTYSKI